MVKLPAVRQNCQEKGQSYKKTVYVKHNIPANHNVIPWYMELIFQLFDAKNDHVLNQ